MELVIGTITVTPLLPGPMRQLVLNPGKKQSCTRKHSSILSGSAINNPEHNK